MPPAVLLPRHQERRHPCSQRIRRTRHVRPRRPAQHAAGPLPPPARIPERVIRASERAARRAVAKSHPHGAPRITAIAVQVSFGSHACAPRRWPLRMSTHRHNPKHKWSATSASPAAAPIRRFIERVHDRAEAPPFGAGSWPGGAGGLRPPLAEPKSPLARRSSGAPAAGEFTSYRWGCISKRVSVSPTLLLVLIVSLVFLIPIFVIEGVIQYRGFCRYHLQLHTAPWAEYSFSYFGRFIKLDFVLTFRTRSY